VPIPRWADTSDETPALITASRTWTRREVDAAVRARIDRWGDVSRIAIVGTASVEHVLDLLAAVEARIPALMLHPRWTRSETDAIVARFAPSLVVDGGIVRAELRSAASLEGALAVVATSGTGGAPKLAVLSRRAFVASAGASAAHLGRRADDRWLLAMPLAHVGGLGVVVRSIVYGSPIVLHEGDPSGWLPLARAASVTHVSLVPTGLARLLDRGETFPPSVRVALVGGAACPEHLLERAIAKGVPIHRTYGLTETCGQVATTTTDPRALVPLVGVDVRIMDGTIRVRSPAVMDGWLDSESPFDSDGFYDTGDLGTLEGAHLTILARRTDLVISGGENVYPREVEDALERIAGVRAACVFGEPDLEWGQRVAAAIVVDGAPSDEEIVRRARERLSGFKIPRRIARIDALALNGTGKIDRAATAAIAMPLLRSI